MKKILVFLFIIGLMITPVYAEEVNNNESDKKNQDQLLQNATNGLLIEATTGEILYEKGNKDEKVAVASMTKMVAQIIILEQIEKGNLSWDEKVTISQNASGMGGSQIFLETGEVMTVRELMKGITMASANDATVAMAERIGGTEQNFVKMMNEKVKELGLKNTNFVNPTGLDEDNHYSSAYDMAMIAKELLRHEEILDFSSVYEDYLRVDTPNKFWLVNTNKLVRLYDGADGLKTGFTDNAGYCMAVTAKRDDMRIIAVVLGEKSGKVRNQETMDLLDYGFNNYKVNLVKSKKDVVSEIKFDKGDKEKVDVVPVEDISMLSKKSEMSRQYDTEVKLNKVNYPINKGDIVGKILVKDNNKVIREVDLTVVDNVKKINYFKLWLRTLKNMLSGQML